MMETHDPHQEQLVFIFSQASGRKSTPEPRWDVEQGQTTSVKRPWQLVRDILLSSLKEVVQRKPKAEILVVGLDYDKPDEVVTLNRVAPTDSQMVNIRAQAFDRWVQLSSDKYQRRRIRGSVSTFLWVEAPKATVAVFLESTRRTKSLLRLMKNALGQSMVSLHWFFLGDELASVASAGSSPEFETHLPLNEQLLTLLLRELYLTPNVTTTLALPNESITTTISPFGMPSHTPVYSSYGEILLTVVSRVEKTAVSGALEYGYPMLARSPSLNFHMLCHLLIESDECITLVVAETTSHMRTSSLLASLGYDVEATPRFIGRPSPEGMVIKGLLDYRTISAPLMSGGSPLVAVDAAADHNSVGVANIPHDPFATETIFGTLGIHPGARAS